MDRLTVRCPAEWEPQARTWLAWPHNPVSWEHRPGIIDFYSELIGLVRRHQPVSLLVPTGRRAALPAAVSAPAAYPLEVVAIDTDDIWIRDYGPLFVAQSGALAAVSFEFNAWGGKFPPWRRDNDVPARIAETKGIPLSSCPWIFEGGAIEVNGRGVGVTTRDCLVGPGRNPEGGLPALIREVKDALGLTDLLVLDQGLDGDHTDGHIDNVARFVAHDHVVVAAEDDPASPNHKSLRDAYARLSRFRPTGEALTVSTLPLPPQRRLGTEILPASYMNFIFVNGGVIVPLYRTVHDERATRFFEEAFPDRVVKGIDCTLVIEEGGSLHCLSKQEPLL